jgi:hypothetical protein
MQKKKKKTGRQPAERVAKVGIAVIGTYLLAVVCIGWAQGHAINALAIGDTETRARELFWFTPGEETPAHTGPARGWTTSGTRCTLPCVRRLWWVHPLLPDLEAWTVDLNDQGKVIASYRWSSP